MFSFFLYLTLTKIDASLRAEFEAFAIHHPGCRLIMTKLTQITQPSTLVFNNPSIRCTSSCPTQNPTNFLAVLIRVTASISKR